MSKEDWMDRDEKVMQPAISFQVESLIRQYGNDVLRTAYCYVHDIHIAEDLFQEVFIKVYRGFSKFQGESSVKTWIIRITINTCKDYLKSAYHRKVVPTLEIREDALISSAEYDAVECADENQQIMQAILELPEKYREPVICVYYQDMTIEDTAYTLGIPTGTVKSRLSRARERLKSKLEGRL